MALHPNRPGIWLSDGVRVELAAAGEGPKWHLLFPLGHTFHRDDFGPKGLTFSVDMLQAMAANYEAEGKPERAVNYFHRGATTPGDRTPIEQKVASGWIKAVQLSQKAGELGPTPGLYAQIDWTKRAREYIEAKELGFLSPEFTLDRKSKRTGKEQGPTLLGAALLNDPFLTELPRVAASDAPQENHTMAIDPKKLRARLKLAETATDEEVEAEVEKGPTETDSAESVQLSETVTKLTESVAALTAKVTAAEKENAALKLADRKGKVEAFVSKMVKEGRVTPAIREDIIKLGEANGLESIKFLEKQQPALNFSEQGINTTETDNAETERDAASKKFLALADELHGKLGGSYRAAHAAAKAQLPKEYALHASRGTHKQTRGDA